MISRGIKVYDIETLSNFFSYCDLDIDTLEEREYIIHQDQNDLEAFITYLLKVKYHIGYNNLAFDGQIIQYIIDNHNNWIELDGDQIAKIIYDYSQYVINKANNGEWSDYPEWKLLIKQIDLYKIWHFDNKAKRCSLKWIQFAIDYHNIEEMPIHHASKVTKDMFNSIMGYNKNDVRSTYELYKITKGDTSLPLYKGLDKLQLRKDIKGQYRINCSNYNDVKIGDELNKIGYMTRTGRDKKSLKPTITRSNFTFGDCIPEYVSFKTEKFNLFFDHVRKQKVDFDKTQEFLLELNGTIYTIMKGGIHSQDKPRIIMPSENEILQDADIGSQYPNAIRKRKLFPSHLGEEWLDQYIDTIRQRLEAKSLYKQTKDGKYQAIQEALKLSLNGGGFGKTGEINSWQYDPFVSYSVTIGNQFEMLMLIEELELNGIHIVSANTDGIVSLFSKDLKDKYYSICKEWELKVGNEDLGQLEYCEYSRLIQTSVNDYIAVTTDGKIKKKGDFCTDFELHKNKSARIVSIAVEQYFINNIPIEDTIKKHQNIFDFCLAVKGKGDGKFIHLNTSTNEERELQKINRYFVSTNGLNLLKRLKPLENKKVTNQMDIFGQVDDGTREHEVESGWLTTIYNKHYEQDIYSYNIDYNFYIQKANKIIKNIQ